MMSGLWTPGSTNSAEGRMLPHLLSCGLALWRSPMFRGHVKGVKKATAKGRVYYYHRRTGTRIKARFGTAEFVLEVARLEETVALKRAMPGTLGMLIDAYRESTFFADLRLATRISYDRAFEVLQPIRAMPLVEFKPGWVAGLRDEVAAKRGRWMANNVRAVLSILAEFGREKELLTENPVKGIRRLRESLRAKAEPGLDGRRVPSRTR